VIGPDVAGSQGSVCAVQPIPPDPTIYPPTPSTLGYWRLDVFPTKAQAEIAYANGTDNATLAEGTPGPFTVSAPTPVNLGTAAVKYSFSSPNASGVGGNMLLANYVFWFTSEEFLGQTGPDAASILAQAAAEL
jgi:hypothetical protein